MKRALLLAGAGLVLALMVFLPGCSSLAYYWQGAAGQLDLLRRSQPIDEVIADASTDATLKRQLEFVRSVREYASRELTLPDNRSYRVYADVGRPFVTWNVFAAPEFSLASKEWCFPIAGCVSYRGYFSEQAAKAEAATLKGEGYDAYVGGVPAYSTLGYFDDPVLSTFVHGPQIEVARLIFHELAHQVVYVKGDSMFNESFAVSVEEEGVRRWLAAHGTPEQVAAFEGAQLHRAGFRDLVRAYRKKLQALYAEALPPERMRQAKAQTFADMRAEYAKLKATWGGWGGYDHWFSQNLNNANIVSVGLYNELVPAFQTMQREARGNLPDFYAKVRNLAALPKAERDQRLAELGQPATTAAEKDGAERSAKKNL